MARSLFRAAQRGVGTERLSDAEDEGRKGPDVVKDTTMKGSTIQSLLRRFGQGAEAQAGVARAPSERFVDDSDSDEELFVDGSRAAGAGELSYQRAPIPTAEEAARWAAALSAVPKKGAHDASFAVDYALRFALLAYGRNDAVVAQSCVLLGIESGEPEVIELQFHGTEDFQAGAHLVVYLYRLETEGGDADGVGVVLAYKGSTKNVEDWRHNLRFLRNKGGVRGSTSFGAELFPAVTKTPWDGSPPANRAPDELEGVQVHAGFMDYKRTLDDRMKHFSMAPLRSLLEGWGAACGSATNFLAWLRSGSWTWCVAVGHSLGGAMAAIAATELATKSGKRTLLATLGAPMAGNMAFVRLQNSRVGPGGGLRIFNPGDAVPFLGYTGINVQNWRYHGGRKVQLQAKLLHQTSSYHLHLRFTAPSTSISCQSDRASLLRCRSRAQSDQGFDESPMRVTFKFPGASQYKPSCEANSLRYNLGGRLLCAGAADLRSDVERVSDDGNPWNKLSCVN